MLIGRGGGAWMGEVGLGGRRTAVMLSMSASGGGSNVGGGDTALQYCLLEEMAQCWCKHWITIVMVCNIFMYMDRTYVPQHRRRPVYNLGLWLFQRVVWERDIDGCLNDNDNDKDGDNKDSTTVGGGEPRIKSDVPMKLHLSPSSLSSSPNPVLLGSVASGLLLHTVHQDQLNHLVDPRSAWPSSGI
jgi:hypothetical protein